MAGNDGILIVHSMLEIAEVCISDVVIADRHHLIVWYGMQGASNVM